MKSKFIIKTMKCPKNLFKNVHHTIRLNRNRNNFRIIWWPVISKQKHIPAAILFSIVRLSILDEKSNRNSLPCNRQLIYPTFIENLHQQKICFSFKTNLELFTVASLAKHFTFLLLCYTKRHFNPLCLCACSFFSVYTENEYIVR